MNFRRGGRLLGIGVSVVGVVLLVTGLTHLSPTTDPDFSSSGGNAPVASPTADSSPPSTTRPDDAAPLGRPTRAHGPQAPDPSTTSAAPTPAPDAVTVVAERPSLVSFDRLGVSADIDDVLSVDNVLGVPPDPARVGWWIASAFAGADRGTVVLDGHVDSATRGLGFFVHLRDLTEGDSITLTTATGRKIVYAVDARQTFPKSAGLPPALFDLGGKPTLLLVTCGGTFDRSTGSYADNIAVTARPL